MTKYIFVTGGVTSSLGKGIISASLAKLLQARGYRNFTEIAGGFAAIAQTNVPKTDFVCASKLVK